MFSGIIASSGIAIGKAFVLKETDIKVSDGVLDKSEVESDIVRFKEARDKTVAQLEFIRDKAVTNLGKEEAEVFEGHIVIAADEELEEEVIAAIRDLKPVDFALNTIIEANAQMVSELEDPYLRERQADVKDVGKRMLKNLLGIPVVSLEDIEKGSIIVAHDLTPSETSQINLKNVWGFITNIGGRTSHSAIMARSLELPAIVGSKEATNRIISGDQVVLDAVNNKVLINPDEDTISQYRDLQETLQFERADLAKLKDKPCETQDGRVFEICANIGTANDVAAALRQGAEGVGLYRTEFLFMDRPAMPTEEEQFEAYKVVADSMECKPVIIRTLDIGGDKELDYLDLPHEMNPFLGWRAIWMCFDKPDILHTQLLAILRASAFGKLKIMFPMVVSVQEVRRLKEMVEKAKAELRERDVAYDDNIGIGIMVETPAAVMVADLLIKDIDFFSIGTNDLTQYILAVDRGNEQIADMYDFLEPSVLRAIKQVIDCSHVAGKRTGMCGEMSGDEKAALLLAGMGLDEFSMSATSIPKVKRAIRQRNYVALKDLADKAVNMSTAEEVRGLLDAFVKQD